MNHTLHIVNGTVVTNILKQAKITGDFLAWDDFLHEGPVPKKFSLQQLSKIRAYYMAEKKYNSFDNFFIKFKNRNKIIENHQQYNQIILWFEQDLYDQLQLLQILDWFAKNLSKGVTLNLISTNRYFRDYSFKELQNLTLSKEAINAQQLELAKEAWNALCETNPMAWFNLLEKSPFILPFLKPTILRLLEEFPNTDNGLSRTEYQALLSVSKAHGKTREEIFKISQKYEQQPFLADIIFWKILDDFVKHKLIIKKPNNSLVIGELGKEVLNNKKNWLTIKEVKHWIGGVHLSSENLWCWNIKKKTIKKYYYSTVLSTLIPVKQSSLIKK